MMLNKKLIVVTLILLSLFMIGAVSAASDTETSMNSNVMHNEKVSHTDTTTDISSNSESVIEKKSTSTNTSIKKGTTKKSASTNKKDDDKISSTPHNNLLKDTDDGTFTALNNKIVNVASGATINLEHDYTYSATDNFPNGIIINKSITINGNGFSINANKKARIFLINTTDLCIKNLKFINGNSSNGGAIYFNEMVNCNFTNLNFINNFAQNHGGAIYVDGNTTFNKFINITFTSNTALRGGASYFNGTLIDNNLNIFANYNTVNSYSGAVFFVEGLVMNNKFSGTYVNNSADHCGGVFYFKQNIMNNLFEGYFENNICINTGGIMTTIGTATNNTFKGHFYKNSARIGGALYFYVPSYNNTIIGDFINNTASNYGGAIYFRGKPYNTNIINSRFINNKASSKNLTVDNSEKGIIKAILTGNNNVMNAFCAKNIGDKNIGNLIFKNVTYWAETGFVNSDDVPPIFNDGVSRQKVTLEIYKNNKLLKNLTKITDKTGSVMFKYPKLNPGTYNYLIYHENNTYCTYIDQKGNITIPKIITKLTISPTKITYNTQKSVIITLKDNNNTKITKTNIIVKINGKQYNKTTDNNGQIQIPTQKLIPKTYTVKIRFPGNEKYLSSNITAKIIVNKANTKLTASKVTTTYNINRNLVITLKDKQGNKLTGMNVTVKLGTNTQQYKTNKKGQITIPTQKLNAKTYKAQITFKGNNKYIKSSTTTKITIKKATPKLTAKAKTFNKSVKIKKYNITLNNNLKKPMKTATVTLNVNSKNYKIQTNAKGVATFQIKNLNKKGKYTATITYKGDKNYNKITKKVKITIK